MPAELCFCPVALPTVTLGAAWSMLTMGASAEKYMSVSPESTMPVACKENVFFLVVMAGLKLAVLVNVYLDFLKKLLVLTVPHRHNALRQPGGGFSLLLTNS